MTFIQSLIANRRIKITLITLIVIGLILTLLPLTIQWGAQYALKKQGASEATIDDINLNLFTGRFELKKLKAVFNEQPALTLERVYVDIDMSALFQSRIVIEDISIESLNAVVLRDEDKISINGYQLPASKTAAPDDNKPDESKPLEFSVNSFSFLNSAISYSEQGLKQNIIVKAITLKNLISWEKDSVAKVSLLLAEGNTAIDAGLNLTLFTDIRAVKGSLAITGLNTQPYQKFYKEHLDKLNANIDIDVQFDLALGEQIKGNINHKIELTHLKAHYQQLEYSLDKMSTQGKASIHGSDVILDAKLELTNSQLSDLATSTLLKSINHLTLNDLHFDQQKISFSDLTLKGIQLLNNDKNKKLLSIEAVSLKLFKFDTENASIKLMLVNIQQPNIDVTLSEKQQVTHLALIDPILKRFKQDDKTIENNNDETKPLTINIAQIRLSKPGLLHFNDLSVQPNYNTTLHFNKIDIDNMSSENLANFNLALKQGDYTSIDISGKGLLFDPTKDLSYTIDIKQLDLPPVSSYTSRSMGYGVKSGVVDTLIKGSIKQQEIDTHIVLKIDSIEVIETNKETAAEISGASGMSIDLALSTLKDKHNIIDLEMPVGGNIKKPDFDLSLIINKAMGLAMKAASMSYLKHALQPFSSLVTLFSLASDAASSISLAPISFSTNAFKLAPKQKELLDKVASILVERPGIKIKACGIASLNDQSDIKQQLLDVKKQALLKQQKGKALKPKQKEAALKQLVVSNDELHQAMKILADNRSASVKTYLTKIKHIQPAKILNCLSAENLDKESTSVVELLI